MQAPDEGRVYASTSIIPAAIPATDRIGKDCAFTDTLGPRLTALSVGGVLAVAAGEGHAWRIGRPAAKTIEPEPSPPRVASEWSHGL